MCVIQCINCPVCYKLTLVPLKSDCFNREDSRQFRFWERKDLVRCFCNASQFYSQVYDYLCMNPECPRRQPDYALVQGEQVDSKCNSTHCTSKTCCLVTCCWEDYCRDHHPRSKKLMKKAPVFRVWIYHDADLRHADPFLYFMKHRKNTGRENRAFPFV